ncbi:hypothetical protein V1460_17385 [Streptomyces sp. SCSIO 30461]|uniref:hypothetical protein n=1 Tax=Streptomyces sp. SCSIO 30461 TaxID=3118085 RepID=UPI0030CD3E27
MVTKRARVGLAIAGVASVGLLFPAVALAADNAPTTATESTAPSGGTPKPREEHREARKDRMEERQEELAAALAKELGVSEDKVKAALEKIRSEKQQEHKEEREKRLKEAVSEGKLTQEQADAILKAAESGVLPWGPGGGHGRAHG